VELIFVFAVILFEVLLIHFFEVVEIVGAFGIDTLMDDKVLSVFLGNQSISTMGTAQFHGGESAFPGRKPCGTDLAEKLSFGTVIPVKKWLWGITARAGAVIRDVALRAAVYRPDLLAIAFFVVGDEFFVSPVLPEVGDQREFVNLELLVFWGMGIIKSPLLKRDVSADKI